MTEMVGGKIAITDETHYTAEEVNPLEGVRSEGWIRSEFKR